jgi:lactoylglutathione lyase
MSLFRAMYAPTDFDRAAMFWADQCGLAVVASWDDDGRGAIFQAPGAQVEIFGAAPGAGNGASDPERPHRPPRLTGPAGVAMAWEVDDVDATFAAMVERGAHGVAEPADRPWGMRMATVQGPDAVLVSVFSLQ